MFYRLLVSTTLNHCAPEHRLPAAAALHWEPLLPHRQTDAGGHVAMEMALETSEASNTARKLQLSANCWTASSAGRGVDGGGGELVKQARYIAKKFTTSVGQLIEPLSRGLNSMIFFCKYFIGCLAGNLAEICVPGTGTGQGICIYAVAALKWA